MQSSYRVIKSFSVVEEGKKSIVTDFETKTETKQKELGETNARTFIDSYENLARTMVEDARKQRDSILSTAYAEAERIEEEAYKNAYEKGYEEGSEKGYNDGFNKAYQDGYQANVDKAMQEGESIKNNADNVLKVCIAEKEKYIVDKEKEIKELIVNCVESILRREIKYKEGLNGIVFDSLSKVKNTKTIIIKSKAIYCEEFKKQTDLWKEQLPFKGDIFIIPDESIEEGSAIIERENGKIVISVDIALNRIREIFNTVE
ncbi:flagellar assembly protein FliH [Clostridium sp. A1-XYC3]|uniref:Flagellar assembly protein FliH n=1 Tax=Clostridium tanneri TaxID=3037988 RepID=A0ABU4JNE6_9CLOT|nr:flagellar assembly protein FliH [Clostridium sp. A1-XYC3]MDW8799661.1 flagellar assembly protein FliH [Clostridium sp. A1-XYC3]